MAAEKVLLGITDYAVFSAMLLISASIGLFFRFSGGKQKTTEEFLMAGRDMSVLPVALSLFISFTSGVAFLGFPVEVYLFGIDLIYMNVGSFIGLFLVSYITLPVFFQLQASSAYEYLALRFGKVSRYLTSGTFVAHMILYTSCVLFAPALALSAVSNLSILVCVISIGIACTFYCVLGGMKAVIWTDVFQSVLLFFGTFAIIIQEFIDIGLTEAYLRAKKGGRLDFPKFDFDPTIRYTFWSATAQGIVLYLISFGGNQVQIQRLLTVKTLDRSRRALNLGVLAYGIFNVVLMITGLILYVHFSECDPMSSPEKPISSTDQLLPYYQLETLSKYPGLAGLSICGVFSASLSTVSSILNALTAVTMEDFFLPILIKREVSKDKMAYYSKATTLFYGVIIMALTYVVASLGGILQASLTLFGVIGGPVASIFLLGMLTTTANEAGAVIGLISSVALTSWLAFASVANPPILSLSVEGCPSSVNLALPESPMLFFLNKTYTTSRNDEKLKYNRFREANSENDSSIFFNISYMWLAPFGSVLAFAIGYIVSFIINIVRRNNKEVPDELLSPVYKYFNRKKRDERIINDINKTDEVEKRRGKCNITDSPTDSLSNNQVVEQL